MCPMKRRKTPVVRIDSVAMGGRHPVVIQSMTDTPTEDRAATFRQTVALSEAGAELVRWTVNNEAAAESTPHIIAKLRDQGHDVPIVGDFHFNGHVLLAKYPRLAKALAKYRINPGNIGRGRRFDDNFAAFIRLAKEFGKPVRIGVNAGSLDPQRLTELMTRNAARKRPLSDREVLYAAMLESALRSADLALKLGLKKKHIVLSVKMSDVQDMITVYRRLARSCDLALHLGLTEAGSGDQGVVASTSALAVLLHEGIGDTIRVSLTPSRNVPRTREVEICRAILQALDLRRFVPRIIACPGCGRTAKQDFQVLAEDVRTYIDAHIASWRRDYPGCERMTIAVMGCVVNGPGESRHADIGISLPGRTEKPQAVVYTSGRKTAVLNRDIKEKFLKMIAAYVRNNYSRPDSAETGAGQLSPKDRGTR